MTVRKKTKLVFGSGRNDADYPVSAYAMIHGRRKQVWMCPMYRVWTDMLSRCYSEKVQARSPTYAGCTVAPEWHSFSVFRAWMEGQDWQGKDLDKDILIPGNKRYSPDACVFVSAQLNKFLIDSGASRGEFPIGVAWNKKAGKFQAQCNNPFTRKQEGLGLFTCQNEAHEAWRSRKHEHACTYADMQTDLRIAAALRIRYANRAPRSCASEIVARNGSLSMRAA